MANFLSKCTNISFTERSCCVSCLSVKGK